MNEIDMNTGGAVDMEAYNKAMAIRAFVENFELPVEMGIHPADQRLIREVHDAIAKAITQWENDKGHETV